MKRTAVFLFLLMVSLGTVAQRISVEEYIQMYKDIAIEEMVRTGVPAAIKLAQGIVETENGNSPLVKKSNNHFGIKCKETWTGPWVSHDDDAPKECFRKYNDAFESYKDHSDFLRTRKHYNFLFSLDPADYKAWAYGLKKAGYATNPRYPEMLIKHIEQYSLNQYSLLALQRMPAKSEPVLVKNETKPVPTGAESTNSKSASKEPKPQQLSPKPESVASKPQTAEPKPQPVAAKPEPATVPVAAANQKLVTSTVPVSKNEQPGKLVNTPAVTAVQETKPAQSSQPAASPAIQKPVRNYPAGEFRINETRVVFAKAGTPLLAVAQQYNLPLKYLLDFNDLPEVEQLIQDQLVYLQRKRRTGANAFHIVAAGETLYDIAQVQGIRLEALLQLNQLREKQQPAEGEQLYLQSPAPHAPRLSNTSPLIGQPQSRVEAPVATDTTEIIIHIVQPKETLYAIARRYEVSLLELQQWNRLSGNDIREGMELIINKPSYVGYQGTR